MVAMSSVLLPFYVYHDKATSTSAINFGGGHVTLLMLSFVNRGHVISVFLGESYERINSL